ncbi:MAG: hypothetical protein V4663_14730 [Bacteroidota bacterium]
MKDERAESNAFVKAFPDEISHLCDWMQNIRNIILDIDEKIASIKDRPAPSYRPTWANKDDKISKSNQVEKLNKEKSDLKSNTKKYVAIEIDRKQISNKQLVQEKVDYLLDEKNIELDKKPSDKSFDYMANAHFIRNDKKNGVEKASERFAKKLSSYKEINIENNNVATKSVGKDNKKDNKSSNPKPHYKQSLSFTNRMDVEKQNQSIKEEKAKDFSINRNDINIEPKR